MYQWDEDEDVRFAVYANPSCPIEMREGVAEEGFWSVDVRRRGAASPYCRQDLLIELATDPDNRVRQAAVTNPNAPQSLRDQGPGG